MSVILTALNICQPITIMMERGEKGRNKKDMMRWRMAQDICTVQSKTILHYSVIAGSVLFRIISVFVLLRDSCVYCDWLALQTPHQSDHRSSEPDPMLFFAALSPGPNASWMGQTLATHNPVLPDRRVSLHRSVPRIWLQTPLERRPDRTHTGRCHGHTGGEWKSLIRIQIFRNHSAIHWTLVNVVNFF